MNNSRNAFSRIPRFARTSIRSRRRGGAISHTATAPSCSTPKRTAGWRDRCRRRPIAASVTTCARTERNREIRARELGIHDEKDRLIAEWVAARGTPDQQDRHAAGMLSIKEVLEGMADEAFAAAGERPRYVRDGISRLESYLRQFPQYAKVVVTKADFLVTSANAEHANEAQWALKQELEKLLPDATLTLRLHRLSWTKHSAGASLSRRARGKAEPCCRRSGASRCTRRRGCSADDD